MKAAWWVILASATSLLAGQASAENRAATNDSSAMRYGAQTEEVFLLKIKVKTQIEESLLREMGLRVVSEGGMLWEASQNQLASLEDQGVQFEIHSLGLRFQARSRYKGSVYGYNETDYDILDNDGWAYSPISITMAPADAKVCSIDVRYYIVHTWVGDLVVQLTNQSLSRTFTLWNRQGEGQHDIDGDASGITTLSACQVP
jgi:hypothetical protein